MIRGSECLTRRAEGMNKKLSFRFRVMLNWYRKKNWLNECKRSCLFCKYASSCFDEVEPLRLFKG